MSQEPKYSKTILCLANSWRPSGRCVAGKEFVNGKFGDWIRPVNAQNDDAIAEVDMQFENGKSTEVLDIVTIQMMEASPNGHQTEDHQIVPDYYRVKRVRAAEHHIRAGTKEVAGPIWV